MFRLKKILFSGYYLYHSNNIKRVPKYKEILLDETISINERIALLKRRFKENNLNIDSVEDYYFELFFGSLISKYETDKLLSELNAIHENKLGVNEWLELSSLFISVVFYNSALLARSKALNKTNLLKSNILSFFLNSDAILGESIENGDFRSAKKALIFSKFKGSTVHKNDNYAKVYSLVSNKTTFPNSEKYSKVVGGCNVAVIGPLKLSSDNIKEIKKYDLVVGLNFFNLKELGCKENKIPINITYNTTNTVKKILDNHDFNSLDNVKAVISRTKGPISRIGGDQLNSNGVLLRAMDDTNPFTFNGGLNFLQRVILDVYIHEPKSIKVFGADLYTTLDYAPEYQPGKNYQGYHHYLNQMVQHDLITQFKLTKWLFKENVFEPDNRLLQVLNLSLEGYLRKMQSILKTYMNYPKK